MSEDIHGLLAKYFNGQATAEEIAIVENWIAADEQHKAEFELLEKLWTGTGEQHEVVFDMDKAWKVVDATLNPVLSLQKRNRTVMLRAAVAVPCVHLLQGQAP
jgi:ferric-dicitrate binding protein FerR (iron transport regulator)